MNFYNEIDEYAARWLVNLIDAGHIAPGVVDTRSIEDIAPDELHRFTQCHFFAGIGVWSLALRAAGWPDDRPVWTGSCPCQPFSAAGKGAGFADERHLWPAWHHLISERKPAAVFGEQVASKDADPWIDLVQTDLEALGYAFGAVPFPAASVGAPHIRDRLYWVADDDTIGRIRGPHPSRSAPQDTRQRAQSDSDVESRSMSRRLADGTKPGLQGGEQTRQRSDAQRTAIERSRAIGSLAHDDDDDGLQGFAGLRIRGADLHDVDGRGPVNGPWSGADWIPCRDNKWRPIEPGTSPLAHGAPGRVGRLRAYGNAIVAAQAQIFIESFLEIA